MADRPAGATLQAEVPFTLPHGYVGVDGMLHRDGVMRLATARDEIAPLVDPRVARNRAYLVVLLLSRVVTRLGTLEQVTPEIIEGLFASDFGFLQDLYRELNADPLAPRPACPSCGAELPREVMRPGGVLATPPG